ncbi:hypothetical protein [Salisaeta longa]|uniref:hypothetical protein n=1 Tax=Salisaeta longa TaxID=503170 RepID=UPI0003B57F2E|nr:hypothetical protein [Salisaeta longa]
MSHIDSFRHALVGHWAGLPVYHPLEPIRGDFTCGPEHLVLGGGSGEHPAMVVEDPTSAVAQFLVYKLEMLQDSPVLEKYHPLKGQAAAWLPKIRPFNTRAPEAVLVFYDWRADDHARFRTRCQSPALVHPWQPAGTELSFLEWLVIGFGEFVFFAMPDLVPSLMQQLPVDAPYTYVRHVEFSNLALWPPNMPVYANGGNAFSSRRASSAS